MLGYIILIGGAEDRRDDKTILQDILKMIPGVLELSSKTIYGLTAKNVPIYRFRPLNKNLPESLVGCSFKDRSKNIISQKS
jgi:hypothetical protein